MNTHSCIKCSTQYKDNDVDAYYCPECMKEKERIAKEIDSKIKPSKKETVSALQQYDMSPKVHGFVQVRL